MKRTRIFTLLGLLLFCLASSVVLAAPPETALPEDSPLPALEGKVVPAEDTPVSGVRLGRGWLWNVEAPNAYTPYDSWPLKADGTFRVSDAGINNWPLFYPLPLFALSADGKQGAVAVAQNVKTVVTLHLSKLIPVCYQFQVTDASSDVPILVTTFGPKGAGKVITVPSGLQGVVPLPPGEWEMHISSSDTVTQTVPFTVPANRQAVDLGVTRLSLGPLARQYGKPAPPLTVTETLNGNGTPTTPFALAAFKGKWVLLDFWGWWCPPCVNISLPEAVAFYNAHPEWRDRYQIFAFHCLNAKNSTDLAPHLRSLEQTAWKGHPLPFPILMDATEKTITDWGITLYPMTVLLDPNGHVVRGGSLKVLEEKLREAADARPKP